MAHISLFLEVVIIYRDLIHELTVNLILDIQSRAQCRSNYPIILKLFSLSVV